MSGPSHGKPFFGSKEQLEFQELPLLRCTSVSTCLAWCIKNFSCRWGCWEIEDGSFKKYHLNLNPIWKGRSPPTTFFQGICDTLAGIITECSIIISKWLNVSNDIHNPCHMLCFLIPLFRRICNNCNLSLAGGIGTCTLFEWVVQCSTC